MDLVETFGPMSAMHAAMDRLGIGMPCGFICGSQKTTVAKIEAR